MEIISELLKSASMAAVGAAVWGRYVHWRSRTFQKKLLIEAAATTRMIGERRLVFIEIQLTNAGRGKLEARRVGPAEYVYWDEFESLNYSCSLQLRRVSKRSRVSNIRTCSK
jgi:hypothetical protein